MHTLSATGHTRGAETPQIYKSLWRFHMENRNQNQNNQQNQQNNQNNQNNQNQQQKTNRK